MPCAQSASRMQWTCPQAIAQATVQKVHSRAALKSAISRIVYACRFTRAETLSRCCPAMALRAPPLCTQMCAPAMLSSRLLTRCCPQQLPRLRGPPLPRLPQCCPLLPKPVPLSLQQPSAADRLSPLLQQGHTSTHYAFGRYFSPYSGRFLRAAWTGNLPRNSGRQDVPHHKTNTLQLASQLSCQHIGIWSLRCYLIKQNGAQ